MYRMFIFFPSKDKAIQDSDKKKEFYSVIKNIIFLLLFEEKSLVNKMTKIMEETLDEADENEG